MAREKAHEILCSCLPVREEIVGSSRRVRLYSFSKICIVTWSAPSDTTWLSIIAEPSEPFRSQTFVYSVRLYETGCGLSTSLRLNAILNRLLPLNKRYREY